MPRSILAGVKGRVSGAALGAVLMAGCAGVSEEPLPALTDAVSPSVDHAEFALPPSEGVFDYQLGGAYDTVAAGGSEVAIDVVVREPSDGPLEGAYSVCYVNGFQSQPGDQEVWLETGAVLRDALGEPVFDPDWPDELVLDPATPAQRAQILEIVGPWIDDCAAAGFDAVEMDNLDTFTRFPGVAEAGAMALVRAYVARAHDAGLAIAQKNTVEIAAEGLGFDFAVVEECAVWDECEAYIDAYGSAVLQIEYPDALAEGDKTFAEVCGADGRSRLLVLRDRDLVPRGEDEYVRSQC